MSWRDFPPSSGPCPPLIVWLSKQQRAIRATDDEKVKKKLKREAGRKIAGVASSLSLTGCSSKVNGNE